MVIAKAEIVERNITLSTDKIMYFMIEHTGFTIGNTVWQTILT